MWFVVSEPLLKQENINIKEGINHEKATQKAMAISIVTSLAKNLSH